MLHHRTKIAPGSARKLAVTVALILAPLVIEAQAPAPATAAADASADSTRAPAAAVPALVRATAFPAASAPAIDGRDDDAVWAAATPISGFRVFDPKEDGEPSFPTEVRFAYDAENLYVFVRMFDPAPDSIVSLLCRRDVRTQSEQIKIMIDSYHDRRTGVRVRREPGRREARLLRVRRPQRGRHVGRRVGRRHARRLGRAGRRSSAFRSASSAIPSAAEHTFGLHDHARRRAHQRAQQLAALPAIEAGHRVAVRRADRACVGLASPRRLEVVPYVVTQERRRAPARTQRLRPRRRRCRGGPTSSTASPRTSRSTRRSIPTSARSRRIPPCSISPRSRRSSTERRPFFLEGAGIFSFAATTRLARCSTRAASAARRSSRGGVTDRPPTSRRRRRSSALRS